MKQILLGFVLLLLIPTISWSADFRNVNWGMTKEQVMKAETGKFVRVIEDGDLQYEVMLLNKYKYILYYSFIKGELAVATYTSPHKKRSVSSNEWRDIEGALFDIYGKPYKKGNTGMVGVDSLVSRDYRYYTQKTEIHLNYFGLERLPEKVFIKYYSKDHKPLYDEMEMQKSKKEKSGGL